VAETRTEITAQEPLSLPDDGKRYELVEGAMREIVPAGARHGSVAARLMSLLDQHVRAERLGKALAAETGFRVSRDPDTVRAPDVSFVTRGCVPPAVRPKSTETSPRIWPSRWCRRTIPPPRFNRRSRCG